MVFGIPLRRSTGIGWLLEYEGSAYYGRKNLHRAAEFIYNHIVCQPMLLWLAEASKHQGFRTRDFIRPRGRPFLRTTSFP